MSKKQKDSKPVIRMKYQEYDNFGKVLTEKLITGYIATAEIPVELYIILPQNKIEKELGLNKSISILLTELGYKIKDARWEPPK